MVKSSRSDNQQAQPGGQVPGRMDNDMKIKGLEHNYTISNVPGLGLVVIGRGKRKLKGQVVMLGQHADMESAVEAVNKYEHWQMGK